jgi:putative aminopeptidase FrvX
MSTKTTLTFITDTYGTVGIVNPTLLMLSGHADEISWYVNYITDDGLIYVIRNGGSDHQILQNELTFILKGIVKVFWMASYPYRKGGEKEEPR